MRRATGFLLALMLMAGACTNGNAPLSESGENPAVPTSASDTVAPDEAAASAPATTSPPPNEAAPAPSTAACAPGSAATAWEQGPTASAERLLDGPITVDAVVYPRPDYEGRPWSQWGQGIVLADGRFLSAMGDHIGPDGNSYLFEYNPSESTLTRIADALTLTNHQPGAWGYGKIHAQMVTGPCGDVLVTTYWGTRRDLEFSESYRGDVLFRLDPSARTIENLGVFFDQHGVPSLASHPDSGLLYGEAVDPLAPPGGSGSFVAVDAATGEIVFSEHDPGHSGFRSMAVADDGRAFFSLGGGSLGVFDPAAQEITEFPVTVPGDILRAVTTPTASGTILGVTDKPPVFFELDPTGDVRVIADAAGYTTSIARSPDASTIYYVPDAHGGSWRQGTPLIAVDTASGSEEVLVQLNEAAEERLGLRLGGTYSVAITEDGKQLYIGMNAGQPGAEGQAFGEVVLLIVTLP